MATWAEDASPDSAPGLGRAASYEPSLGRVCGTLRRTLADLELTRAPGDRRLYTLDGVGTLRLKGLASRAALAEAGEGSWRIARSGFWRRTIQATAPTGAVVGEFEPGGIRRGGSLHWAGRGLTLRPASRWRERYALADGELELAVFDGKGWGRHPVKVTVDDLGAIDPGLLLFAAFVVRGLAEDASAATSTTTATASGA